MFISLDDLIASGNDKVVILDVVTNPPLDGARQMIARVRISCALRKATSLNATFYGDDGQPTINAGPQPEIRVDENNALWPAFEALCVPGKAPTGPLVVGSAAALDAARAYKPAS